MERSKTFRPSFVVGCERSGTTLLAVMLGRHTQMAMTPETHFLLRVANGRGAGEAAGNYGEMVDRFFASPRGKDLGLERAALLARFEGTGEATYKNLFQVILEMFAEAHGKALAAEKTPFHLWRVPLILEWFPEAKVVGIVRDGRDVVLSILSSPWTADPSLRRQCMKWTSAAKMAVRWQKKYPGRFLLMRYEDLVCEAEKTLREVDGFLGLEFEAGQLEAGGPSDVVPAYEKGWKANATDAPDKSRIGKWEKKVNARERLIMHTMMGSWLKHFGYPETKVEEVTTMQRMGNAVTNFFYRIGARRVWFNVVIRNLPSSRKARKEGRFRAGVFDEKAEVSGQK